MWRSPAPHPESVGAMKVIPHKPCNQAVATGALALFLVLPVHAATFILNPSADALVTTGPSNNLSANNYGGAGLLADASAGNPVSFRLSAADSTVSYLSFSGNNPAASVRPLLSIAAIPEPHTFILFAAGAIFLGRARYRRGKRQG